MDALCHRVALLHVAPLLASTFLPRSLLDPRSTVPLLSAARCKAQTIKSMAMNAILGLAGGYTAADTEPSHYATKVGRIIMNLPHGTSISRIPQLCIA